MRLFPPGRTLSIEITIGDVRVTGSARSDIALEIVRRAPADNGFARLPIAIDESAETVRVRVAQADGNTDPALRSDVTLLVPHDARLDAIKVMEGRIVLNALHGTVNADIRRGPIEATDVSGTVRLETSIGPVTVDKATLTAQGLLRLRTFNGDVTLSFAERPRDARVLALALNGTIRSDIPLTMKDTWGPRFGETTLGRAEPVVSIDVITGRIEIRSP